MNIITSIKKDNISIKSTNFLHINSIFFLFVLCFTFFIYSCSENNSDKNKPGSTESDGGINLINNSIDNFITQLNTLPKIEQDLGKIDYQPFNAREELSVKTASELNNSGSEFTDDKAIMLNTKFQEMLNQWTGIIKEYKTQLKDYESANNAIKEKYKSLPNQDVTTKLMQETSLRPELNDKFYALVNTARKLIDIEKQFQDFRK